MSATFLTTCSDSNATLAANATQYLTIGCASASINTTESLRQITWRQAGTTPSGFSNLYGNVFSNGITANSTFAIRNGGVTGNNSITYGSGVNGELTDVTHTDSVAAGNLVNYIATLGATGTTMVMATLGIRFSPDTTTNTVNRMSATSGITDTTANATYYNGLASRFVANVTEANVQFAVKTTATLSNLLIVVSANTASVATYVSRIGGAPGNLTISIGTGATGQLEDTTHTDNLSSGNLVNTAFNSTVTTSITVQDGSVDFTSTNGTTHYINGIAAGQTFASNSTNNLTLTGRLNSYSTETQASCKTGTAFTASQLETYIISIVSTPSATLFLRIGAANANQNVTPTSGVTRYTDATHTDGVAPGNEINTQFAVALVPGTSMTVGSVGFLATLAIPGREIIVNASVNSATW